ncbi:NHLP leader peptide family RiPP precursor [Thermodesulfobacteriota bacterium]
MKKTIEERKQYAKIIAKAWIDEEFKKRLFDDPATVLKESGIDTPERMTVKFVEGKENEILLPIPSRPPESAELSDEDLEKVAGGLTRRTDAVGLEGYLPSRPNFRIHPAGTIYGEASIRRSGII